MIKTVKKVGALSLALLLLATPLVGYGEEMDITTSNDVIPISEPIKEVIKEPIKEIQEFDYLKYEGTISEVNESEYGLSLAVDAKEEDSNFETIVFNISDELLVLDQATTDSFDKDKLEEDMEVEVFYSKTGPMTMSLPPQTNPALIIVKNKEANNFITASKFNNELTDVENTLKINLADTVEIVNQDGEKLEDVKEEDLFDKNLVVFYTASTRSIPAQTTPEKIIVLEDGEFENNEPEDNESENQAEEILMGILVIVEKDNYYKDSTLMVPLRKVSEYAGYEVEWNAEDESITLRKQNSSFLITLGKEEYGYNKSLGKFKTAPELKDSKTYVPDYLVIELVKAIM